MTPDTLAPTRGRDLLEEAGRALYGPLWQSEMARELEVALRTMQRWARGDNGIPAGVFVDLRDKVVERRAELAALARKLPKRAD
jgi:hypothetical protein